MESKPQIKTHMINYPEDRLVYKEMPEAKAEVLLPEHVVNTIKERAEVLEADVSVRIWWPYMYIFIEKDISKQIEDCYDIAWSKTEHDALDDCQEKCGDNDECFDKCMDVWKHSVYTSCLEDVGDDIRPSITKTINELENVFKIYGIKADVEAEWNHDIVTIRALLRGYDEIIPIEIGQLLLMKIVDASMAKSYKDRDILAYKLAEPLLRHLSIERLIELHQNLDRDHIHITKTLDNYEDIRRYEMIIEQGELKIYLHITEEKEREHWTITDLTVGAIENEVADLTPA